MATTGMRVEGLQELGRRLRALGADVEKKVKWQAALAMAGVIRKEARARAPVAPSSHTYYAKKGAEGVEVTPGNLKRNVVTKRVKGGPHEAGYQVTVKHKGKGIVGEPYAEGIFTELGTPDAAPEPWLRPAFDTKKVAAVEAGAKKLRERIAKAEAGR